MKNKERVFFGIVLLLIGAYYALKACGVNISPFIEGWWCILLVVIGVYKAVANKQYFGGCFIAGIGVIFFLTTRALIAYALQVPLILVLIGVLLIIFPKNKSWSLTDN